MRTIKPMPQVFYTIEINIKDVAFLSQIVVDRLRDGEDIGLPELRSMETLLVKIQSALAAEAKQRASCGN